MKKLYGRSTKLKQLEDEINSLKSRKNDLESLISELNIALKNADENYKWFEIKSKLHETKGIKSDLKSTESELKEIEKNLPKLEKNYSKEITKSRNFQRGIIGFVSITAIIAVTITIGSKRERNIIDYSDDHEIASETEIETSYTTASETTLANPDIEHTFIYDSPSDIISYGDYYDNNTISSSSIPLYRNKPYAVINNNIPKFNSSMKSNTNQTEKYSPLDKYGRCGVVYANICREIMPTEPREEIGSIYPSGWHTIRYDNIILDRYLYNRCHLIAYQLSGENANERNLITGTRYMNVSGMLPFENMVADYVKETGNHVFYRVSPIFVGNELIARGVQIEAWSVEDNGSGICFNVYCYNVQPGIVIDYSDGSSKEENIASEQISTTFAENKTTTANITKTTKSSVKSTATLSSKSTTKTNSIKCDYVANKNSYKFHKPNCVSVKNMKEINKLYFKGSREQLISQGYKPCKSCNP